VGKMDDLAHSTVMFTTVSRHSIVVISNQKLSKDLEEWKQKIHLVAASVSRYSVLACDRTQPKIPPAPERIIQNLRSVSG
jgi:hypothetical protein